MPIVGDKLYFANFVSVPNFEVFGGHVIIKLVCCTSFHDHDSCSRPKTLEKAKISVHIFPPPLLSPPSPTSQRFEGVKKKTTPINPFLQGG